MTERSVEVVVTAHARQRLAARDACEDLSAYSPSGQVRHGLRLWLAPDQSALLVQEQVGTCWEKFVVITALSAEMVAAYVARGVLQSKPRKARARKLVGGRSIGRPGTGDRLSKAAVSELGRKLLPAIAEQPGEKASFYAAKLGITPHTAGLALGKLRRSQRVRRSCSGRIYLAPRGSS